MDARHLSVASGLFELPTRYDVRVPLDHRVNNTELSFQFVRALNPMASLLDHWIAPPFSASVQDFVDDLVGVLPTGATIVALHADTMSDKMWSDQGWRELLERFLSERPDHFVFVVGHQVPNVVPRPSSMASQIDCLRYDSDLATKSDVEVMIRNCRTWRLLDDLFRGLSRVNTPRIERAIVGRSRMNNIAVI
jgi:hypothetical protein